ncbi:TPA: 2-hydroxychromene-2-carboxylate isomerase [Stenotrophomonas maltophilia]|jgi:2-hydroxychromene-2-carboxylate isomerase|nr:2-hydroxychromene-2-carboxylate isomerase [Stenotrophomonas maltophilia]HEL3156862.1 2-hydroxychromene-2-carboxylate isomerase [Stenotrophomonas maltophilia]HEL3818053.1 2-hydroxychromene-2-carboxylate isomerase [Stenotrophomonas maltophilia]
MKAPIEIWFDFASNYSYLSVMRIEEAARQAGRQVQWRPFLLGPIFQAQGWNNSPFVLQKAKGIYVWQDMLRQCRKHGLPWQKPSVLPRVSLLASRVALYGAGQAWIGAFCRQVMTLNFAEDRDITDPQLINEVLGGLGLDAPAIIAAALSEQNKQALRTQTEQAMARGIFGAPTFFVGEGMFWGDDRLADALANG